ncbi:hypothetical protein [Cytobacillus sp. BC1816]|uniref:hypothetical protein n=1 Tax=Cytobacillus sp. BC1816 TaxID=3440154 RepID=UPI003F51457F
MHAELIKTPEDTLFNYFSILREASSIGGQSCGSIDHDRIPVPLANRALNPGEFESFAVITIIKTVC